MRLRVGNACWHTFHIADASLCKEIGFYEQEGLDVEVVHAKVYSEGFEASREGGERYDEVGTVLRDMVAFGIDIIPDIHVRTPFAERALGNDEIRIIGGWRNQWPGTAMAAPGIESVGDLAGKTIGDWYRGGVSTMWWEHRLRQAGIDPDTEITWKVGYRYGSIREAWKPLLAGETDAAIVQNPYVSDLLERGFHVLEDIVEASRPHGRPDRVTVARQDFIARNPDVIKRYWRAAIRGYQYNRIVPEHFPMIRFVEAKLRQNNPDESERMRPLRPIEIMEGAFFPLDGQVSVEGVWGVLQEHQSGGTLDASVTRDDVREVLSQDLVKEAWDEVSQTEEVKRNLERLQPVIERVGY